MIGVQAKLKALKERVASPLCDRWLVFDNMDVEPMLVAKYDECGEAVLYIFRSPKTIRIFVVRAIQGLRESGNFYFITINTQSI